VEGARKAAEGQADAVARVESAAWQVAYAAGIRELVREDRLRANHQRTARPGEATRDARIGRGSPGAPGERGEKSGVQKGLVSPVHRPDHFTRGTCGGVQGISVVVPAGHGSK